MCPRDVFCLIQPLCVQIPTCFLIVRKVSTRPFFKFCHAAHYIKLSRKYIMHASACAPDWGPAEHHARDACCSHGEWQVAPDCPTQAPRCARDECCSLEKQRSLSNQLPRSSLFIEIETPWQSPGKSWSASDGTWQTSFHVFA